MENMATFIATLLHSATNTHFFHFTTNSYAQHVALGAYYDEIVELTDALAESYMGLYGQFKSFPNCYHNPTNPLNYLESLQKFVEEARGDLPEDSQLQNQIDAIAELIDSTIYKLKFLK